MRVLRLLLPLLLFCFLICPVSAMNESEIKQAAGYDDMFGEVDEDTAQSARDLTEHGGVNTILGVLQKLLGTGLGDITNLLSAIFAFLIFSAVFRLISESWDNPQLKRIFSLIVSGAIGFLVFSLAQTQLSETQNVLKTMGAVMKSITGTLCVLGAMGGYAISAAASQMFMSGFLSLMEMLAENVLTPVVTVSLAFCVASLFSTTFAMEKIGGMTRKCFTWLIGFLMSLLTAVLAVQKVFTSGEDTLGIRGVKFALGTFVPVIGASLGDAVATLSSTMSALRGMAGALGMAAVICLCLRPVVGLLLARVALFLCSCAADVLKLEKEAKVLEEAGEILGFLLAILCFVVVIFLLQIVLLISVTVK